MPAVDINPKYCVPSKKITTGCFHSPHEVNLEVNLNHWRFLRDSLTYTVQGHSVSLKIRVSSASMSRNPKVLSISISQCNDFEIKVG